MSIRCWCTRVAVALTMMLAFGTAVQAQVDVGGLPQTFQLSSREDCTALRSCLADPELRDEVEACFALGPIKQFDFRLFFASAGARIYMGRMIFSSNTAALGLSFVYRTGADPLLAISTNATAVRESSPLVPDLQAYDFLAWLFQDQLGPIVEFAESEGILTVNCQHVSQRVSDSFSVEFRSGEFDWNAFMTAAPRGKSTLSASVLYDPSFGYYDFETN